ncbi:acetyltransferase [Cryomyces antarcticus]
MRPPLQEWHRTADDKSYLISTSRTHLDPSFINTALGAEEMYWARPLSPPSLQTMLDNSLTLGLYVISPALPPPQLQQIGMARFITDFVSTAYLTDVYVLPAHRGGGLGKWLVACCKDVIESLPDLRRAMLMASPGAGERFYEKALGMKAINQKVEHIVPMSRRREL